MIIEFLIIGKEFRKIVNENKPNEHLKVYKSQKKGNDDYLLRISTKESNNELYYKELSDYCDFICSKFKESNIKYYILSNDASSYYLEKLYPLASEFELKLRKFITWSLVDICETVSNPVSAFFSNIKEYDKDNREFKSNDFLYNWTLDETFRFLFDKTKYEDKIRKLLKDYEKQKIIIDKSKLIEDINLISERNIWDDLFATHYSTSMLPENHVEIIKARNAIMHFHLLNDKQYNKYLKVLNSGITEIDSMIKTAIQLEPNVDNISKIIQNNQFILDSMTSAINSFSETLKDLSIGDISKNLLALSDSLKHLSIDKVLETFSQRLSDSILSITSLNSLNDYNSIVNKSLKEYLVDNTNTDVSVTDNDINSKDSNEED